MKLIPVVLCLLCLAVSGCQHAAEPVANGGAALDASVNGTSLTYMPEQEFSITLESLADAGYRWECTIGDTLIVAMRGEPTYKSRNTDPRMVGGYADVTFRFHARANGISDIHLIEHQPWMKNVAPLHTVAFSVVVGDRALW